VTTAGQAPNQVPRQVAGQVPSGADGRRTILHVDMDAFFVSVELLDRPDLAGQPVVVGGDGRRGVVAAANYEARRHGVFSAMSAVRAAQLCPDLVFLPGHHHRYTEVSRRIMEVFTARTPLVEPISLDEAFLDVTGAARLLGDGVSIAHNLRDEVFARERLWCSVGVASTKFVAKLASQQAKPRPNADGTVVGPGVLAVDDADVLGFLHPLPVSALWGVGPATLARLTRCGIATVGDLARTPVDALVSLLGASAGRHLHELANGRDDRPVQPHRKAKSVGHEQTYVTDLHTAADMQREVLRLCDAVASRLAPAGLAGTTVTVKVRFSDFATITRSATPAAPVASTSSLVGVARELAAGVDPAAGVRLLGVSVSGLVAVDAGRQLTFDDVTEVDPEGLHVQRAVDAIRDRWGADAIGPAALLQSDGLQLRRRGDAPWGPDDPSA
jgi:DNA polymerase IV